MKKIVIIGAGVMGKIFLQGAKKAFPQAQLVIADRNLDKLRAIKKSLSSVVVFSDSKMAVKNASLIILAVKPQSFVELAKEIKGRIAAKSIVLSIMAGVKTKKIIQQLGVEKIIRAMPNLGARVNKSMTVWFASKKVSLSEKKTAQLLFMAIGRELLVRNEEIIDKATAVSGSGPGFFFLMIESWLKAIAQLGFSLSEAKELLFSTLDASLDLLRKNGNPTELRQQVASKGGTTEAGLNVLIKKDLDQLWRQTLRAAYKRAKELSKKS